VRVSPGEVHGRVEAPPSKSVTIRAFAAAALAKGTSTIANPSRCLDAESAIRALQALGADFSWQDDVVLVRGAEALRSTSLECGESALCMRMLAPVAAALTHERITLRATGSLRNRPMKMLEAPLRALGGQCTTDGGRPPVRVQGPLRGGCAELDASSTSQVLTGLLFALPLCPGDSELEVPSLVSSRYVEMTLAVLRAFGIRIEHDRSSDRFRIPARQHYVPCHFRVEGDWSAAAFFLVAGAIAGDIEVTGLHLDTTQADAAIVKVLRECGATIAVSQHVRSSCAPLDAFHCDVSETPDLLPALVVLACSCRGTSELSGIERTRLKESDRVAALLESLGRLGASIEVANGCLRVKGGPLRGGSADACGDHRIAMAIAIAALRASGPVEIQGAGCVAKSHPRFFDDLKVLLP